MQTRAISKSYDPLALHFEVIQSNFLAEEVMKHGKRGEKDLIEQGASNINKD